MIYKRKVYNELLDWKNSKVNNSALLIEGARRIGKSTIVEEFAKNEFDDYILIDFMYETEEMMNLFKDIKNLDLFYEKYMNGEMAHKDTFNKRVLTEVPKYVLKKMSTSKNENDEKNEDVST